MNIQLQKLNNSVNFRICATNLHNARRVTWQKHFRSNNSNGHMLEKRCPDSCKCWLTSSTFTSWYSKRDDQDESYHYHWNNNNELLPLYPFNNHWKTWRFSRQNLWASPTNDTTARNSESTFAHIFDHPKEATNKPLACYCASNVRNSEQTDVMINQRVLLAGF